MKTGWAWFLGVGSSTFLALGCDFPFDASKFEVDRRPPFERLVAAFTREATCADDFEVSCGERLRDCAALDGCVELAACVREKADPVAEVRCARMLETTLEQHWRFELVRHCWADRYAVCEIGTNFGCAGNYGPPGPSPTTIDVRHQLRSLLFEPFESPLFAKYCSEFSDCTSPAARATMEAGAEYYDVELEVGPNSGVGNAWSGYRLVEGEPISPSVIESSLPFWGPHVEITRLIPEGVLNALSVTYGGDAHDAVFVQVVDCLSDPAPGITLEVPSATVPLILYAINERESVTEPPTRAVGAVGIHAFDPGLEHKIEAWKEDRLVAKWTGRLHSGKPMYLRLYPRMME